MARFLAAVAFLTRLPLRRSFDSGDVGRSAPFFPVVGAGIGFLQLAALVVLEPRLPSLLTAVLVVALSAWLTRGLHLDGLADFADGLGGGRDRDQALRIMRDPRTGSFGAVALVLVLAIQIAAVDGLRQPEALIVAPALARWASVPLGVALPYAREGRGMGSALTENAGAVELAGATAFAASLFLLFPGKLVLSSSLAVVLVTLATGAIARARLGGVTGDVLGANVELSQGAALVAAVAGSTC